MSKARFVAVVFNGDLVECHGYHFAGLSLDVISCMNNTNNAEIMATGPNKVAHNKPNFLSPIVHFMPGICFAFFKSIYPMGIHTRCSGK